MIVSEIEKYIIYIIILYMLDVQGWFNFVGENENVTNFCMFVLLTDLWETA